jgi:hypothetical protein
MDGGMLGRLGRLPLAERRAALVIDRVDVLSASGRTHRALSALTVTTATGDVVIDRILGSRRRVDRRSVKDTAGGLVHPPRMPGTKASCRLTIWVYHP